MLPKTREPSVIRTAYGAHGCSAWVCGVVWCGGVFIVSSGSVVWCGGVV